MLAGVDMPFLMLLLLLLLPGVAFGQDKAQVVSVCGVPNSTYSAGTNQPVTQDANGLVCVNVSIASPSVTYAAPTGSTVSTGSATIVAAPGSKITGVCNVGGAGTLTLDPSGGTAVSLVGVPVAPNGCAWFSGPVKNSNGNIITGISSSGTITYAVIKGS